MLYLSRKPGESVIVNGNIEVIVEDVQGKTVKLGFLFPEHVNVLRKEVFERIEAENKVAALGLQTLKDLRS
ncbi:Carbon storage regulator CsrA [Candidatus Bealeia paramacronuclearis]|uniref:Translational regulator CsrA n=1 Tax=Candidatus Bealeia paramacronuclearis TaxID=1921001 RepID=A0ABZ2C1E7_9PROT|nr:Carbon storage regulator CsrA [Candidatus Bealeia paramacronuclearis]